MSNITICILSIQINDTCLKACMVTTLNKIFSANSPMSHVAFTSRDHIFLCLET